MNRNTHGFTLVEVIYGLIIAGVLAMVGISAAEAVARGNAAMRHGSDSRALQGTVERVLRRAVQEAGAGMPSAPNLSGVGVAVADRASGAPADTLVTLRADGAAAAVAARPCRDAAVDCVALVGDQRAGFRRGDVLVLGTRGHGLRAVQVGADPQVFTAPCAGDCSERLQCPTSPGPARYVARIIGSVRHPGGATSALPCAQPFYPDGSRCEEIVQPETLPPAQQPSCSVHGPTSPFTELRVVDRTAALGYPVAGAALARGGAAAFPRVRAVRVRASRFFVRAGPGPDTSLVRQNGLDGAGAWRASVVVASPVVGLRVTTLHDADGWLAGPGVTAAQLVADPANPNYLWRLGPSASGLEPGARFARGHNTIANVRVRYLYRVVTGRGMTEARDGWIVVPTRALLDGGSDDVR